MTQQHQELVVNLGDNDGNNKHASTIIYSYSVKVEQTTKGLAAVIVHTYHNDAQTAKDEAIKLFIETRDELKSKGIKVLEA